MKWTKDTVLECGRITLNSKKSGRLPSIRDTGVPVELIAKMSSDGMAVDQILAALPILEREDVQAGLRYHALSTAVDAKYFEPIRNRIRRLNSLDDE